MPSQPVQWSQGDSPRVYRNIKCYAATRIHIFLLWLCILTAFNIIGIWFKLDSLPIPNFLCPHPSCFKLMFQIWAISYQISNSVFCIPVFVPDVFVSYITGHNIFICISLPLQWLQLLHTLSMCSCFPWSDFLYPWASKDSMLAIL